MLVLATGFKVFDAGNMPAYPVSGREGLDLQAFWDENRHQAYEGISVPGFPNYFTMFGPYGYNGSSYFNLVETQARHIVRCLSHARDRGATHVEVTPRGQRPLLRRDASPPRPPGLLAGRAARSPTATTSTSTATCRCGRSPTLETIWRASHFDLGDYRFTAAEREPALASAAS